MSHCFGVMCSVHRTVMADDTCPERDCAGSHGYTNEPCDPRCSSYTYDAERCACPVDDEGEPIPSRDCELHWRQVMRADLPPPELIP